MNIVFYVLFLDLSILFHRLSFVIYATRMLLFTFALVIAARPDLDNPGCYRNGWDIVRGIFEGLSLILFLVKAYDEIGEFVQ